MSASATKSAVHRVLTEDTLSLTEARTELFHATGRRADKGTLCRWIHKGVGGVRLDAVRVGNQLITSRQAITRFIEARTTQSVGVA